MKRTPILAALALGLLLTVVPAWSSAQSLSAIAGPGRGFSTQQKATNGCWVCSGGGDWQSVCSPGVPGYWNCNSGNGSCTASSPGCGAGASLLVDPDGAVQFVSRSAAAGQVDAPGPIRRNCEGVIVARYQPPEQIARVRARTGSLTL